MGARGSRRARGETAGEGGGMTEQFSSAVLGGGGITEHDTVFMSNSIR